MADPDVHPPEAGADGAAVRPRVAEERRFPPSEAFRAGAVVSGTELYVRAADDPAGFWAEQAGALDWFRPWETVLEWDLPFARWFGGGTLNVSVNCLDRHVAAGRGDRVAFHFEGEPGDTRTITYADLLADVVRFANVLLGLGVRRGDRVAIYLPMIPELPVAMLACARIGAPHSVVFSGLSPAALRDRIGDAGARFVVTADGGWHRGSAVPLKAGVDEALEGGPPVDAVIVARRVGPASPAPMTPGRDHWWHELVSGEDTAAGGRPPEVCQPEAMGAEDLLFLLYTSGTTARPKGIMHTTGGYLTQVAHTERVVFDLHPDTDVLWCTVDIGWAAGHGYAVYGPLANGATSVLYEGAQDRPGKDRWWSIVDRYGVTTLYTTPTAIRTSMAWGDELPAAHDLSTLRVLGSVGEPIDPGTWLWYSSVIGGSRCPVVDTWWQTETGAILVSPLPGVTATKPGSAAFALPGNGVEVVDAHGRPIDVGGGYLTLTRPWPAMLRGIYGEPDRYRETYWSRFPGRFFTGDGARVDEEGYLWMLGRVDDVMNVAGHRISAVEVESALVDHPDVAEAAVVGASDPTTGQAVVAFVTLWPAAGSPSETLGEALRDLVAGRIGAVARPRAVIFTGELPRTGSGTVMHRLLRDVAEGRPLGDTATLADPAVADEIRARARAAPRDA